MGADLSKNEAPTSQPAEDQEKLKRQQVNDKAGETEHQAMRTPQPMPAPVAKLPHNYKEILKEADHPLVDAASTEKLYDQLLCGVFLNQHNNTYWVDKDSKKNCFMLYAKGLSITWAEDSTYWRWPLMGESSSDASLVAAELINVCWLEVHGRFNTINLTPATLYEVVFVVMLKDPAYGWEVPINLRLILPNGSRQEHKENMIEKARGRWIEIPVGEFETSTESKGEMEISLYE